MREPKHTLEKKFDIARVLAKMMDADLGPVYEWAEDYIEEYRIANKQPPEFLSNLLAEA